MEPSWSIKLIHIVAISVAWNIASHRTAVQAAPIFYVSNQSADAAPGLLDLTVAPNSSGTLHIWADTDVRLCAISLDLVETAGAIKFTGLEVPNPVGPPPRWAFLDGPQQVTDSEVNHIGGAAPKVGLSGDGIGPGTLDAGPLVRIASVSYTALNSPGAKSHLSLRVGNSTISDITGNFAQFHFGTEGAPRIHGDQIGASGFVGSITIVPEPASGVLTSLGVAICGFYVGRERRNLFSICARDKMPAGKPFKTGPAGTTLVSGQGALNLHGMQ
jgi:hypothetical protein